MHVHYVYRVKLLFPQWDIPTLSQNSRKKFILKYEYMCRLNSAGPGSNEWIAYIQGI